MREKIEKYFRLYPHLRVLFFFDPEGEYQFEMDSLELENLRIVRYENNAFRLKTLLKGEWKADKVFLYFRQKHPRTQDEYKNFPLLGQLVANKELALDDAGSFLEEFGLQRHQKPLVAKYMKELKYSSVQEVCRPVLTAAKFEEHALIKGLIAYFLKFKQMESWPVIIGRILTLALADNESELIRVGNKIITYNLFEVIQKQIKEFTGIIIKSLDTDELNIALRSIFYNRITQTISVASPNDPYKSFKIKETDQLIRLNQLLQEVERNPRVNDKFQEALSMASEKIKGEILIKIYGIDENFAFYSNDMIWEIIHQQQANISYNPQGVIKSLEDVSMQVDLDPVVAGCLNYMIQSAKMHGEINKISTYILNKPSEYLETYADQWFMADQYYRKAINAWNELDTVDIPDRIDIAAVNNKLNTAYEKHLDVMNREWLKCLSHFKFDYKAMDVPKQYDFYKTEIAPIEQKVVVIISDAIRYEVACELLSELHNDPKNTAVIRYQLASLPSKTSVGMSNLLPGNLFTFKEGKMLIDGKSTEGIEARQQILTIAKPDSIAMQFSDISGLSKTDLREIFKKQVVYIYHDVIDATGDKKPSERRTFSAVKDAINELKILLPKIHHTFNVAKVLVTADHGFLYNDREIQEKDKEEGVCKDAVISSNRFEIVKTPVKYELGYQFPLSATTKFKDDLYVITPASVNRYKKSGVGHQFVHGGGSLQELVVPVIESSRKTEDVTQKVMPILMKKGELRIVSNILRFNLLQEKKVSRWEKEITLSIGLYKDLKLVSNEATVTLDSTADSPSERIKRIELMLSHEAAGETVLKLKVFKADDKLNPIIEELVQNNTLIESDF